MRVSRILKSVRTDLLPSLMILLPLLLPGVASAITSPSGGSLPFLETLCDGDCGDIAVIDSRRADAGFVDDFSLGLRLLRDGLDLTLKSDGNILIYGAASASGTIDGQSDGTIEIGSGVFVGANDVTLQAGSLRSTNGATFSIAIASDCDCSVLTGGFERSIRLGSSLIELATARRAEMSARSVGVIAAAVTGVEAILPQPKLTSGFAVYREGDIYIDVSDFEIQNFTVIAGQSIVFVGPDSTPVPEPGTALLLSLGLTMLAVRRP